MADEIGYPVVVRPSYVLGGRAMEIVYDDDDAASATCATRCSVSGRQPGADRPVPARTPPRSTSTRIADGDDVFVAGVMEHIEEAGIHSGDIACSLPPYSLPPRPSPRSSARPRRWPGRCNVVGLMNVQFAVEGRRRLRARGQSARLAHGALRGQGDRRAAGQDRRPGAWPARR